MQKTTLEMLALARITRNAHGYDFLYKESVTVSSAALSARLRELVAVVVKGEVNHREFSMRVPAEHDRDADLVMNEAANRLINQQTEIERLKAQSAAPIAEMSEALGDETLNSLSQVATGIRDLQSEIDALKAQRDVAIKHIAEWCVVIEQNGSSWDDWGQYYKDACRDNALPEIRELLDAAIKKARSDELGVQS